MAPGKEARALYESMDTDYLRDLQRAFELDMESARLETIEFAAGRLTLIAEVLARRGGE